MRAPPGKRRRVALALLITAALLTGCAALVPRLEPPVLSVTGIELGGGTIDQQQVRLTVHAVNPNPRDIRVRGVDVTLELSGQPFASGSTDAAFTLPASGETEFSLNVSANLNTALAALLSGLGNRSVDYHLYGQVHLADGLIRTIPFDQRSRVRL